MKTRAPLFLLLLVSAALPLAAQAAFDPELDDNEPGTSPPPPATDTSVRTETRTDTNVNPAPPPHEERGPMDLKAYLAAGRQPKFIRLDVRGYNIRKSADFSTSRTNNIDFRTKGGEQYPVEGVKHLYYGASVQIRVNNSSRWVYVPYARKNDFQFCESEACFGALAEGLDFFLRGTGVTIEQAKSCGVSVGPEGLILPPGAGQRQREPEVVTTPKPVPVKPPAPPAGGGLSTKPEWEIVKGDQGKNFTALMLSALDKYGKNLTSRGTLNDASRFCPNFSRLNTAEKKEFWVHLFNGIAKNENGFKTGVPAFNEATHRNESGNEPLGSDGRPRRLSMGFFQLGYEATSSRTYQPGCSGIDWPRDRNNRVNNPNNTIYNVKAQMDCAVTIMNTWVSRDGGVGYSTIRDPRTGRTRYQGGANYWSTLRNTNDATNRVIGGVKRFKPCWK